jgi:hypothetical protein
MEALRYPADYDGIIAGAPVNFRTHQLAWELWVAQAVHRDQASYIPPRSIRPFTAPQVAAARRLYSPAVPAHEAGDLSGAHDWQRTGLGCLGRSATRR